MKVYVRILRLVKEYKMQVILALLVSLIYVLMNSTAVWMVGSLIGNIMLPEPEQTSVVDDAPIESKSLNDSLKALTQQLVGTGSKTDQLRNLIIALLIIYLLKNLAFLTNRLLLEYVQNRLIVDLRYALFEHILKLPISFYDGSRTAEVQSIFIRDVAVMRSTFNKSIQKMIIEPLNIAAILTLLFIISVKLTLVALISIPLSAWFILTLGQSIRRKARRTSKQIAGVVNIMQEALQGIRIIKAFCMERFETNRFVQENRKFFRLHFIQAAFASLSTPINEMIGVSIGVALLWVGGLTVLQGQTMEPVDFMRFILLLFAMLSPAKELGNVNAQIQAGLASADRVFSILDTPVNLQDPQQPVELTHFKHAIELQDVSFQYESADQAALSGINLTIKKGEIVALVGMSGAGKSTLVDLIPRFYDVTGGRILIDGHDVRDLSMKSLRSRMGIVTQETILFNDTVGRNIAYGAPDVDQEEIVRAARMANALEFIEALPEGFDTEVGEHGARLSGGQRQRISIARAILKNPDILIMDEATSSLDTEAERKVQAALDNLVQNRTVIVIAHRLSTIQRSDRIAVMEGGQIIEMGSHDELLALGGKYKQLHQLQFAD